MVHNVPLTNPLEANTHTLVWFRTWVSNTIKPHSHTGTCTKIPSPFLLLNRTMVKKKGTEMALSGHHFGKRLPFAKREHQNGAPKGPVLRTVKTVSLGSRFGATYFFECTQYISEICRCPLSMWEVYDKCLSINFLEVNDVTLCWVWMSCSL